MQSKDLKLTRGGRVLFTGQRANGFCGLLLAYLAHGKDVSGCTLHCQHLSVVMARLAAIAGITLVESRTASADAQTYSALSAIELCVVSITTDGTEGERRLLKISEGISSHTGFVSEMKRRLLLMLDNNLFPTDEGLAAQLVERHAVGGGGT